VRVAYFDCFAGISGDMCLGALLGAGVPLEHLKGELARLDLDGYDILLERVEVQGISAHSVTVACQSHHSHRHLRDIEELIRKAGLSSQVVETSVAVFRRLAEAEGAVHGCSPEQVHFHEVGAVDAIIDVVGTAIALDYLEIDTVLASPLPLAHGWVKCHHGNLPLPAPATVVLLKGIPVYGVPVERELVTPTGAAIISTIARHFGPLPPMVINDVGYGAGKARWEKPNLIRLIVGTAPAQSAHREWESDTIGVLETWVDDTTPEVLAYLAQQLLSLGALDAAFTPLQMKKGRPGAGLTVICPPDQVQQMAEIIFREGCTNGLRWRWEQRYKLPRRSLVVEVADMPVRVKHSWCASAHGGATTHRLSPEYEDCRTVALAKGIPLQEVYETARKESLSMAEK